jgi:hypothetical protein
MPHNRSKSTIEFVQEFYERIWNAGCAAHTPRIRLLSFVRRLKQNGCARVSRKEKWTAGWT